MAYYKLPLKAGIEYVQDVLGSVILVDGIDGAAGVDVTPSMNGARMTTMPARKAGFKYQVKYDQVVLVAAADCTVAIFLTNNDVNLGFTDGAQVNVLGAVQVTNGADQRLPVDLAGGVVNVTADNVGISNDNSKPVPVQQQALTTIVHSAPVAINPGAAQALSNDATMKRLVIRNASPTANVAIGAAGVTLANAAILLAPGDIWVESDAAGAAWFATSDTAGADVRVQGVK
jgi:hypothetical protein